MLERVNDLPSPERVSELNNIWKEPQSHTEQHVDESRRKMYLQQVKIYTQHPRVWSLLPPPPPASVVTVDNGLLLLGAGQKDGSDSDAS